MIQEKFGYTPWGAFATAIRVRARLAPQISGTKPAKFAVSKIAIRFFRALAAETGRFFWRMDARGLRISATRATPRLQPTENAALRNCAQETKSCSHSHYFSHSCANVDHQACVLNSAFSRGFAHLFAQEGIVR